MENKQKMHLDFKIIIGLVIVAAGVLLLLESFGYIDLDFQIWDFWPVLLILAGLGKIIQPKHYRHFYWGLILVGLGVLFLLNNLNVIDFTFKNLWPIFLIILGFAIIKGSFFRHKHIIRFHHKDKNGEQGSMGTCCPGISRDVDSDYINVSAILGGVEYRFSNKQLKGGKATAIMGGCEIDLRDADMEEGSIVLDTFAFWGGIEIRIPTDWQVVMRGTPILGGMEMRTVSPENPNKQLIIKGSAVMGGIEIKN